jgi:4'-phosphopantetheinyl transferase
MTTPHPPEESGTRSDGATYPAGGTAQPVGPHHDIEVWAIPLLQPPGTVAALLVDLDPEERRLAERDPRYAVAHGAVRAVLAAHAGCEPGELTRTAGPHGKPRLTGPGAELAWNLSASGDWALLALLLPPAPDMLPTGGRTPAVGVDVQLLVPENAATRLARRYYPEAEARLVEGAAGPHTSPAESYTRLWTYKEAYVKAFGGRLVEGLRVPAPTGGGGPMAGPLGRTFAAALPAPAPGYHAAVALTGDLPPRPHPRTWVYGRPADPRPAVHPTA